MRQRPIRLAALALAALAAGPAVANKPRCRLERVDTSRLSDGQITAYATMLELEGSVVEGLGPQQFTLLVNGRPKAKGAAVKKFKDAHESVDIALVVEVAAQYKPALDDVKEALRKFLEDQPKSMKVSLITFGSTVEVKVPFSPAPAMASQVDNLDPEDDSSDVHMTDAIQRAITELDKLGRKGAGVGGAQDSPEEAVDVPRRLIVVVSDGLNARMDRATFKKIAGVAAKAGIPIHTIAYSPIDSRGPLLNLGDLSKRSNGTFRWAKKAGDLSSQLDTLGAEVRDQSVVTFNVDLSSGDRKKFGLMCRDVRSWSLAGDGGSSSGGGGGGWGWGTWTLVCGGGLFGLLGVLFVAGTLITRRTPPLMPGQMMQGQTGGQAGYAAQQQYPGAAQQYPAAVQQQPRGPAAPVGRAVTATVACVAGGPVGQRVPVQAVVYIGSAAGNTFLLADATVTAWHCELRPDGAGGFWVSDYGSQSGTWVNGRRIAAPTLLADGDLIRVGDNAQFKFRVD